MRIASWNVNSIRARLPNVTEWLGAQKPDIVLLQEIKCETAAFPVLEIEALGYKVYALGQKTYNGVAILSQHKVEELREHLPEAGSDVQSRYIEAVINGVRVASIYLPNGNPAPGEKYDYKLLWMKRLKAHMQALLEDERPVVLGGDYNVIPDAADVYDPKAWEEDALFRPQTRAMWRELLATGYTEAFRALNPEKKGTYTFWDYQSAAWQRGAGLRIDHFLLSPEATDRLKSCVIDREPRGKERASDHTPVVLELRD